MIGAGKLFQKLILAYARLINYVINIGKDILGLEYQPRPILMKPKIWH